MESFDIEVWIKSIPEKLQKIPGLIIESPVIVAILGIVIFFIWHKWKLGTKLFVVLHRFFKVIRLFIVLSLIILVASFIQYQQKSTSVEKQDNVSQEKVLKKINKDNKNQNNTTKEKVIEPIDKSKESNENNNGESKAEEDLFLSDALFNKFIFIAPNRILEKNKKAAEIYQDGITFYQEDNYKQAINSFSKIIKYFSEEPFLYCARGICYAEMGNLQDALFDFDYAIQLDRSSGELYNNRGVVYLKKHQPNTAIKDFNIAIFLDKNSKDININRGYANYILNDYENAIQDWQTALKLDTSQTFLKKWIEKMQSTKEEK